MHENILFCMKMVQIRDVPDDVHRRVKAKASLAGKSLSEFLRTELDRIANQVTRQEWLARLNGREPVSIDFSSADMVREDRDSR